MEMVVDENTKPWSLLVFSENLHKEKKGICLYRSNKICTLKQFLSLN